MTDLTPAQTAALARRSRRWRWPLALAALIAGVSAVGGSPGLTVAHAAPAGATPEAVYAEVCANCHGAKFEGGAGPALTGPAFVAKWQGQPDAALFAISHDLMPLNAPQSLPVEQSRAILSHIYAANRLAVKGGVISAATAAPASAAPAAAPVGPLPSVPATVAQPQGRLPQSATLLAPPESDWLMYNRDYRGQRYSPLAQISARNANRLVPRCIFQTGEIGSFQTSPVAHAGLLYITTAYATYAVDGATCAKRWEHVHTPKGAEGLANNRGVAIADGRLIRGTPDGHLIALDAATGTLLWDVHVVDSVGRYAISSAITAYGGKVFTGLAGGDRGGTGRIFAFEAATGKHLWTFNTIPKEGEFGAETWGGGQHVGGGGSWTTITVDPDTRQLLVPVGNPGSDLDGRERPGDNLFTNSVVALDPDTGQRVWHVQQIRHDVHDWNTAAAPVIFDRGARKYMAAATKAGYLYLYRRDDRALLWKQPITTLLNTDKAPGDEGVRICPGTLGGAEWNGPAYDPERRLLIVNSVDWCGVYKRQNPPNPLNTFGGSIAFDPPEQARGWTRAFDAESGKPLWQYEARSPMVAGVTPTAGGVTMTGSTDGEFLVFDSRSGKTLYRFTTGGAVGGGISTYAVNGRQLVAVTSGNASRTIWKTKGAATLIVFGLPDGDQ